jgi:hypothetical protein
MGMIDKNKIYVVYSPHPIVGFTDDTHAFVIPSGYHLAPYPMANDEIKFTGTYLECDLILAALMSYEPDRRI